MFVWVLQCQPINIVLGNGAIDCGPALLLLPHFIFVQYNCTLKDIAGSKPGCSHSSVYQYITDE